MFRHNDKVSIKDDSGDIGKIVGGPTFENDITYYTVTVRHTEYDGRFSYMENEVDERLMEKIG